MNMDDEMLKNSFIVVVRPHVEFGNVILSTRLIKDRKFIEE